MKIGFDYDGVFGGPVLKMAQALSEAGHSIFIISARTNEEMAGVMGSLEALLPKVQVRNFPGKKLAGWEYEAAKWKALTCKALGLDLFFEDTQLYAEEIKRVGTACVLVRWM